MGRRIREALSVVLMCVPLVVAVISAAAFLPNAPAELSIHVDRSGATDGTAPTWVLVSVAIGLSVAAAALALAGLREAWQVNRRVQRAVTGGAAAVATVIWVSSIELTRQTSTGGDPFVLPIVLAVFGAILWCVLCLVVTPPDLEPAYADEPTAGSTS